MVQNGVWAAALWDSTKQDFVGKCQNLWAMRQLIGDLGRRGLSSPLATSAVGGAALRKKCSHDLVFKYTTQLILEAALGICK